MFASNKFPYQYNQFWISLFVLPITITYLYTSTPSPFVKYFQRYAPIGKEETLYLAGQKRSCCLNVSTTEYLDATSI
jgi:hypothetical protein